jgi:HYDIN/CFA65/VesB-like, Ig-like domain
LAAPSGMNLGSVMVGSSQTQALSVSNSGGSSLIISGVQVSGTGFSVSGLTLPYTLPAGVSANLSVKFAPTVAGSDSASLTISSNASDPSVSVSLSGTATSSSGTLEVTPGSMAFGTLTVGGSQSQTGSVTAVGASATLSSASSSNSEFTLTGLTLPMTIAAGQSVPFTVTFAPTVAGTASGKISFISSGSTLASETASGTGATIQHTIDLSWNASTSTSVVGYNVYRSTANGGPFSKINPSVNPSMNYSDSTVQSGQTYYYVTTAVESNGLESSYSNQVKAVVPSP